MGGITPEKMRVEMGKALEDAEKKGKLLADFCKEKGWDPTVAAWAMIDAAGTIVGTLSKTRGELAPVVQVMVRTFGEKAATTFHEKEAISGPGPKNEVRSGPDPQPV